MIRDQESLAPYPHPEYGNKENSQSLDGFPPLNVRFAHQAICQDFCNIYLHKLKNSYTNS